MTKNKITLSYFAKNISVLVGLVLIWRGLWYVFDEIDQILFGGIHFWSAAGGFFLGLLILYLPDSDLKEIENL